MSNVSNLRRAPAVQCTHETEYLGKNQDLQFVLCRPCGQVFLLQGGQVFSVPSTAAQNDAADGSERPALAVGE